MRLAIQPGRTPGQVRRRRACAAVLAALTLSTAAACGSTGTGGGGGGGSEGGGTGKIVFWDNNGGARTAIWKKIIADFEKANPKIKVEYVGVPIADIVKKYDTALAGGGTGLPDVGGVSTSYLADLAGQGALEPLTSRFEKSSLKSEITPGMIDTVKQTAGSTEVYEMPMTTNLATIWYRKDLFDKAHLPAPTTWDRFYTAAGRLTDAAHDKFGFSIRGGTGSGVHVLDAAYAQSGIGDFWNADHTKTTLNDPKNAAGLAKYAALFKKDTPSADLNNDYVKMIAEFDHGTIGMVHHNLGSYNDHVKAFGKDRFDGLPMPAASDGTPHTVVAAGVDGVGMFKKSKNKAAAWKFLEFAASEKENSAWNADVGQIPSNAKVASEPWIAAEGAVKNAMTILNDPKTQVVKLPMYLPDWATISTDMEPEWQKVLLGRLSAQAFLDAWAQKINAAQADYAKHHKG